MSAQPQKKKKISLIVAGLVVIGIAAFIYSQNHQNKPTTANNGNASANTSSSEPVTSAEAITVAYQTGIDPTKVAQADGEYEAATGAKINWKKFDSGADVIAAVASGDVPLGNIGSSPFAAATSQGLPIEVFYISGILGDSEALVTKPSINNPQALIGKKIAVPYVSTTHYSLLSALKHWNIDSKQVNIINLRPPEITAAWQRGDIDGAYVWEPALGKLKETGKVLVSSDQVGKWGAPTYDLWIVRKDFAAKHPDFLTQFAKVTGKQVVRYQQDPKAYANNADNIKKIAALTGSKPEEVPLLLSGNQYPNLAEQAKLLDGSFAQDVKNTALFLKQQGKVDAVKDSYAEFVTSKFVKAAQE
ncbi:taurine ABC transporter substrate-binding protein [Snodgrassella sp. CFCC 13594]|uniref:taurine ABC transporter substrate-binding protein n=1 Tax=Snodgrassella sp. CFCC 13594 TaxID=1775559 RepID=UPI00083054BA|nr:taurine ABC transporter substrate-binding protein [Snodgrassella sp. CFCC 13594]